MSAIPRLCLPARARLVIAYSGGADSTALLLACARQVELERLHALHIDHGLHPAAPRWRAHCAGIAASLSVPFTALRVHPKNRSETAARKARYRAFESFLASTDVLLTAHHRDDQVETVLLALLRGSTVGRLAGIPRERRLGKCRVVRPLLDFDRETLRGWVQGAELAFIEDSANHERTVPRNFLRHEILPRLRSHFTAVDSNVANCAEHCAEVARQINAQARSDRRALQGLDQRVLDASRLRALPAGRRRAALLDWLAALQLPPPSRSQLLETLRQVQARPDREVCVSWPGAEVRRYRDWLYATAPLEFPDSDDEMSFNGDAIELPAGAGRLHWIPRVPPDPPLLRARFGVCGARIQIRANGPHRAASKLFQEAGVPPWERRRMPFLYDEQDQLAAIADLWFAPQLWQWMGQRQVMLRWSAASHV